MRLLLQRASGANVLVEEEPARVIGPGLVILLGICEGDDEKTAAYMAEKAVNLRVFRDSAGSLNLSLLDTGGDCLVVSNFTLYANCKKGRRPSFVNAAPPETAEPLYRFFVQAVKELAMGKVETGEFGARMLVNIQNDGPVTIWLDSAEIMPTRG